MVRLQAIGHLGKDCQTNTVNGKNVINFSIAHTEKFTSQGQQRERTLWIECAYWTERTGIVPYLKKGTQVFVEGNPELRTYTTKEGKEGTSLALRVNQIELLGSRKQEGDMGGGNYSGGGMQNHGMHSVPNASDISEPMDDLPF